MSTRRGVATNTGRAGGRARGWLWWFGTLVGGGVLILAGTLLLPRRPAAGSVLTVIGCLAGLLPTMWTIAVPVLLLGLAVAAVQRASATDQRETAG